MSGSAPDVDDLDAAGLRGLLLQVLEENAALRAEVAALREEIRRLEGLKGPPALKPSKPSKPSGMDRATAAKPRQPGRRGPKTPRVAVEEVVLRRAVPPGSRFKGYEDFVVQDLVVRPRVIRYRRERWLTPRGATVVAPLPPGTLGHFGPELRRFVLALYHRGQSTVERITTLLADIGLDISKRQVQRFLTDGHEGFLAEDRAVLQAGLASAAWISVDEGALRGGLGARGFANTVILSDDAGQFNVGRHALCRVHGPSAWCTSSTPFATARSAPRRRSGPASGTSTATSSPTAATRCRTPPRPCDTASTGWSTPAPASPPSTGCSPGSRRTATNSWSRSTAWRCRCTTFDAENDLRVVVTRRKLSGGTRSAAGRACRDAYLGLLETCAKLGIRFRDYLGARRHVPNVNRTGFGGNCIQAGASWR